MQQDKEARLYERTAEQPGRGYAAPGNRGCRGNPGPPLCLPREGAGDAGGLHANLASGAYDDLTTNQALCDRLTADLQAISSDKHIRVRYNDEPRPVVPPEEEVPANLPEWIAEARSVNFGFSKVER